MAGGKEYDAPEETIPEKIKDKKPKKNSKQPKEMSTEKLKKINPKKPEQYAKMIKINGAMLEGGG